MPIQVYKVAEIIGEDIVFSRKSSQRDFIAVMTALWPRGAPIPASAWRFSVVHDKARVVRSIMAYTDADKPADSRAPIFIKLYTEGYEPEYAWTSRYRKTPKLINRHYIARSFPEEMPVFLPSGEPTPLIYFRDRLFISRPAAAKDADRAEVVLRVKKTVYDEEAELSSLRAAVANMEAAVRYQESGPKRDPISEDVKLLVWARDGGCCVRCGSKQALHFDHIIPVAKGGGNSAANIQILCQMCNLKKSDKIAF